jgi:hypothetical protein
MNDALLPAIAYAASTPRLAVKFPDSNSDELWIADIKACNPEGKCQVFRDVMFVESQGATYIFGIEHEDGLPRGVRNELAEQQQFFIEFLRHQNEAWDRALGGRSAMFPGSEYASQLKVSAAYMVQREHLVDVILGYHNRQGEYVVEMLEDSGEFLAHARSVLSFDELDR